MKPLRKQFFCPIKQLRKHATVAFGKKIPFVLIFKGLHMSSWVPLFSVKSELRFDVTIELTEYSQSQSSFIILGTLKERYKMIVSKGKTKKS